MELSMLFADIRNSTGLAETMDATMFRRLLNRFYALASDALVNTDAMIDKLVGDEIIGLYILGIAGPNHAKKHWKGQRKYFGKPDTPIRTGRGCRLVSEFIPVLPSWGQ